MIERTFVLIKPDAVQRHLVGQIIHRIESKALKLVSMKMDHLSRERAEILYSSHKGKDFFEPLIAYIISGPIVAMMIEGPSAISIIRSLIGKTFGPEASPGTIRGDFACSCRFNLIHASDSAESVEVESKVFFDASEEFDYNMASSTWEYTEIDL